MRKIFRSFILILGLLIIVFSGYKLLDIYSEYAEGEKLYDGYAERFIEEKGEKGGRKNEKGSGEEKEEGKRDFISIDFDGLLAENKDVIGWIYSENTPINYPIVQSGDNDYYLRRMLDGTYNINGTIFMDFKNNPDLTDHNTIIYGHNIKTGAMFGTLKKYMEQDYYDKHPVIYYLSPDQSYEIQLVAGYVTEAWSETYNVPQTSEEQKKLSEDMISQSAFKSNTSFGEGDKIITLSTCAYDFDGARYVVVGRLEPIPEED